MVAYANAEALARTRDDGVRALLEPQPAGAVEEGRDVREPPARARGARRLRPRRAAAAGRARGTRVPHRHAHLLRRRRREARAGVLDELARVIAQRARDAARRLVHGEAARGRARPHPQEDRRGSDRGRAGGEGRERRAAGRGGGRPALPPPARAPRARGADRARARGPQGRRKPMRALSFAEYERLSAAGGPVPVFREVPGDLWTPVSAFLALSARSERAFLLESVVGGERIARYSFLGRDPVLTIEAQGPARRGAAGPRDCATLDEPLLDALRARLGPPAAEVPGLPRFTGGAVGYLSYDAVRLFETLPDRHAAVGRAARLVLVLPVAGGVRPRAAADRADRRCRSGIAVAPTTAPRPSWTRWRPQLRDGKAARGAPESKAARPRAWRDATRRYQAAVRAAQEHIAPRRHLPGRALAPGAPPPARSIPSTSTARCAW